MNYAKIIRKNNLDILTKIQLYLFLLERFLSMTEVNVQQLDNFILSAILDAKHCASREKVRVNKKYASKPKCTV